MPTTLPTSIYYSKGKLRWLLLVSIIFDLGGLFCFTINPGGPWSFTPHLLTKDAFMGLLALAFGLYMGYAMIKKLGDNAPVITIDDEGIKLRNRTIPWQDVERVEIQEVSSNNNNGGKYRYVVPVLKDPDKYYSESSKKLAARLGGEQTGAPVQLQTTNLNCSTDELLSILQVALENYRSTKAKNTN